jgi:NADPH2:quinone reductase
VTVTDGTAEVGDADNAGGTVEADAWVVTALGSPTEVMERRTITVPPPGPNQVRVAVDAFCLNLNDIDIIRGRYLTLPLEPPFTPGMESVGIVESAGPGAEHLLGQRIVGIPALAHGGYAELAIVDAATAMELPRWVSDADGAAMHYPFHLGWFALHERAHLRPGETLLVHAAAGGTGSGAVTIGKALGARVIATAGTDEKLELCRELGADFVVNYRTDDFVEVAMEATYGRGVDVAFDAVGGDTTIETFRCMGFGGRHLIAGWSQDIQLEDKAYLTPRAMAYGNFSLVGVCLVYVNDPIGTRRLLGFNWPSRAEGQAAHATLLEMMRTGRITPSIGRELEFAEIPAALEEMEQRRTTGRLVAHVERR